MYDLTGPVDGYLTVCINCPTIGLRYRSPVSTISITSAKKFRKGEHNQTPKDYGC